MNCCTFHNLQKQTNFKENVAEMSDESFISAVSSAKTGTGETHIRFTKYTFEELISIKRYLSRMYINKPGLNQERESEEVIEGLLEREAYMIYRYTQIHRL